MTAKQAVIEFDIQLRMGLDISILPIIEYFAEEVERATMLADDWVWDEYFATWEFGPSLSSTVTAQADCNHYGWSTRLAFFSLDNMTPANRVLAAFSLAS